MQKLSNSSVAALLSEMASLLELEGGDYFRVRAYQKAAQIIAGLPEEAVSLPQVRLTGIRGIGKGIASHLARIAVSGTFPELEEMRRKVPRGLLELLGVEGIGPRRARLLYDRLGVDSVAKLKEKALAGELRELEGFGPKVEENIKASVASPSAGTTERTLWWEALRLAEALLPRVAELGGEKPAYAGSLRRGRETVGDIDMVCCGRMDGTLIAKFSRLPEVLRVLAAGETRASVVLRSGLQCDLRVVPEASYGAALSYFTGSKEHNVRLRERALKRGLTLSEYGLFRLKDKGRKRPVASRTEEDVYRALGLDYIPPELREAGGEIELAARGALPRLVEMGDIKGDFHNHTSLSDGADSMRDMLAAAGGLGLEWTFLGDHSSSLGVARGLDFKAYEKSRGELVALSAELGVAAARSIEMEVDRNGALEFPAEEIGRVDLVVAAVHSALKREPQRRLLEAMKNPCSDIIAHASGRQLGRRDPAPLDYDELFAAAAASGTAFEINGQPERQDLSDVAARRARDAGVKIALTTDAHSAAQLAYLRQSLTVARRAGLTRKDVLNSLSFGEIREWVRSRRAKAGRLASAKGRDLKSRG